MIGPRRNRLTPKMGNRAAAWTGDDLFGTALTGSAKFTSIPPSRSESAISCQTDGLSWRAVPAVQATSRPRPGTA